MNINDEIQKLLQEIGPGKMSSTAYDTAWVARLGEFDWELSNGALTWLCEHQLPDGSWGAEQPFYYHDRVISTLAAMIALTHRGRRAQDRKQIEKGLLALEQITRGATKGLQADPNGATVGFEMIVPTLVTEAETLGVIKRQGDQILGRMRHMREQKMSKLAGRQINKYSTPAFSSEMAGLDGQQMLEIENLQESNGSVGHSPSATAYFAMYLQPGNDLSLNYLRDTVDKNGGAPDLYPFDIYERAWILWNLSLSKNLDSEVISLMKPHLQYLHNAWKSNKGVGFSTGYSVPDGDDTIITYELLKKFGFNVDIESVLSFEEQEHFRCYHLEVGISPSVNIHALIALHEAGYEIDHPSVKKIFAFLKSQMKSQFWIDKWHSSPFYTTSHYVIACTKYKKNLAQLSVGWILENQREDGSWGFFIPTAEETAYCLQALTIWYKAGGKVDKKLIKKGKKWLEENQTHPYHQLWIGKGLYYPDNVVKSAIISALQLSREI